MRAYAWSLGMMAASAAVASLHVWAMRTLEFNPLPGLLGSFAVAVLSMALIGLTERFDWRTGERVMLCLTAPLGSLLAVAATFALLGYEGPFAFAWAAVLATAMAFGWAQFISERLGEVMWSPRWNWLMYILLYACCFGLPIAAGLGYHWLHQALTAWWQWFFGLFQ